MVRKLGLLCATLVAGAAVAGPVVAAPASSPQYVSSEPAEDAEVHETPGDVVVRFSEPLDPDSSLVVRDECGGRLDSGEVEVTLNEMRVVLEAARSGIHTVRYVATGLGGVTGSTRGSFSYSVHLGPSCRGEGGHGGHGGHEGHGGRQGHGGHEGRRGHDGRREAAGHAAGTHPAPGGHGHLAAPSGPVHARGVVGGHGQGGHERHHSGRAFPGVPSAGAPVEQEPFSLAAPPSPKATPAPGAVLAALVASIVVGAIGGWILRATAPRT